MKNTIPENLNKIQIKEKNSISLFFVNSEKSINS
jgi:hypothetical protein